MATKLPTPTFIYAVRAYPIQVYYLTLHCDDASTEQQKKKAIVRGEESRGKTEVRGEQGKERGGRQDEQEKEGKGGGSKFTMMDACQLSRRSLL